MQLEEKAVPRTEPEPVNVDSDPEIIFSTLDFNIVRDTLEVSVDLIFLFACWFCLFKEHRFVCVYVIGTVCFGSLV